jgi:hypothetical protein
MFLVVKGVEADDVKARLGEHVIIIITRAVTKCDQIPSYFFLPLPATVARHWTVSAERIIK